MMKDTALVSFIGVSADQAEIFRRAQLAGAEAFNPVEAYLLAAGFYWVLTIIFTFFQTRLERRINKGYVRGDQKRTTKIVSMSGSGEWRHHALGDRGAVGRPRTPGTGALI